MLSGIEQEAESDDPLDTSISSIFLGVEYSDLDSREPVPDWMQDLRNHQLEKLDQVTLSDVKNDKGICRGYLQRVVEQDLNAGDQPNNIFNHDNLPQLAQNPELKKELLASYTAYCSDEAGSPELHVLFSMVEDQVRTYDSNGSAELDGIIRWIIDEKDGIEQSDKNELILCIGLYCLFNGQELNFD